MERKLIIAIDGPAGSGKSTTAKLLAKKLNYNYLDTGAMYRAVTFSALKNGISHDDVQGLIELVNALKIEFISNGQEILVNSVNISSDIRKPEISEKVSDYSKISEVRKILVQKQHELGDSGGVVVEGRDITTIVFPNADLKIYLTASLEIRAERRLKEFLEKGINSNYDDVKKNLEKRDFIDSNREVSPLSIAPDAIIVDTSNVTIDEQVNEIFNHANLLLLRKKDL